MSGDLLRERTSVGDMAGASGAGPVDLLQGADLLGEASALDAWRLYFETSQRVAARLGAALKDDAGMDLPEYNLLLVLAEEPGRRLRMSVLADRLVFSVPRLSYRVGVLVERGWVRKEPCPDDGRAHDVTLTEDGFHALVRAGRGHRAQIRQVFDAVLDADDITALARIMGKISDAVHG